MVDKRQCGEPLHASANAVVTANANRPIESAALNKTGDHHDQTRNRRVQRWRAGVSFAAGALALAGPVLAQQAGLEEIVVSARFREENLQETPLAITAFSGENMEARNLTDVTMIDTFSPNTIIQPLGAGWGSTAAAFIRGIGLGDNSLSFEPGVPIYIDDVYHGRPQGAILDLLDLERVEISARPTRHVVRQECDRRHDPARVAQAEGRQHGRKRR